VIERYDSLPADDHIRVDFEEPEFVIGYKQLRPVRPLP